jgi:hypothetical protein
VAVSSSIALATVGSFLVRPDSRDLHSGGSEPADLFTRLVGKALNRYRREQREL